MTVPSTVNLLLWISAAIHARKAGALGRKPHAQIVDLVRATPIEPLKRLAPAIFLGLGDLHEAATACSAALDECRGRGDYRTATDGVWAAYQSWLERVLVKARAS